MGSEDVLFYLITTLTLITVLGSCCGQPWVSF